jgi:uncharacterized membrane protein YagU involved in acid resistance
MKLINVIISGIAGTALMTFFMYLLSYLTKRRLKVVKILGTMLTIYSNPEGKLSESNKSITVGILTHYGVGIGFAISYLILWEYHIGKPDLIHAFIFGLINGILGIFIWRLFLMVHPSPPKLPFKTYMSSLVLGHVVFAIGIVITFNFLQETDGAIINY